MTHLSPTDLAALLGGEMPPQLTEAASSHLDACAECRQIAERLTEVPRDIWAALVVASDRPIPAERPAAPAFSGYRVVEELGRGGCGVVYRAEEESTRRTVALKVLRAGAMASPSEQEWFLDEARSAARLNHPNIVVVLAVGEALGHPYYVMEFLPAGSLADRLDGTPLTPEDSARMVESIARAAHHAHEAGVIHRDLKPGNILLDFSSEPGEIFRPKLSDFGMAKRPEAGSPTPTQAILGTPSYMSPEQAFGKSRDVGPASDIYSLGAILYEMLTGRPPFKGATPYETLLLTRDEDPVPPRFLRPGIPRDLDTICLKCLEKVPGRRYPDALALAEDLRAFLEGRTVAARSIGRAERLLRLARRYPITAATLALAGSLIVVGMAAVTTFWKAAEAQRDQLIRANRKAEDREDKLLKVLVFSSDATSRFLQNPVLTSKLDREAILKQLEVFEQVPELPGSPEREHQFAYALLQIGTALISLGEYAQADRIIEKASSTLRRIAIAHPEKPIYLYHYSESCMELAGRADRLGQLQEKIRHQEEAVRMGERLVAMRPDVDAYAANLANFQTGLALTYRHAGRLDEGEALARRGLQENRRLVRQYPNDPVRYRYYSTASLVHGLFLKARSGGGDELWKLARERIDLCEQGSCQADWPLIAQALFPSHLGIDLRAAGKKDEANRYETHVIGLWREMIDKGFAANREKLIGWLLVSGYERWSDDRAAASALFRDALRDLNAASNLPDGADYLPDLIYLLLFCPDRDVRDPARALSLSRRLSRERPGRYPHLGVSLAANGDTLAARSELETYLSDPGPHARALEPWVGRLCLAEVYQRLGQHESAAEERSKVQSHLNRFGRSPEHYCYVLDQISP